MRRLIALAGVLLLAFLPMGAQTAKTADDKSEAVINLENAWNYAEERHDGTALRLLLAETFVYTDYDGTIMDRDQWLRKVQSLAKDYRHLSNVEQNARAYGRRGSCDRSLPRENENQGEGRGSPCPIHRYVDFPKQPLGMCS